MNEKQIEGTNIDAMLEDVLKNLGVDENAPPRWIPQYYESKSGLGGKVSDGYICSRCGKHSHWKAESCDGCGAIMEETK